MKSATTKHILSFGVTAAMLVGAPGCGMFVEGTINEIPPPDTDAPVDPDATTIVETINEIPPPEIDAPVDPDATTNEGADKAASPDADAKDATH